MPVNPLQNNNPVNVAGVGGGVQPAANNNFAQNDTFTPAAGGGGGGGGGGGLSGKSKKQLFEMLILNMFETQLNKQAEKEQQEADKDNSTGEGVDSTAGSTGGPSMADIIGNCEQKRIVAAMKNAK